MDFAKAFDSVEWNFLEATLRKFNYGEDFIAWIKCCYTHISIYMFMIHFQNHYKSKRTSPQTKSEKKTKQKVIRFQQTLGFVFLFLYRKNKMTVYKAFLSFFLFFEFLLAF